MGLDSLKGEAAWQRLEDQLAWYEHNSGVQRRWHLSLKIVQLLFAAAIPVLALRGESAVKTIVAILGASIAVLEGIQQLFQFGTHWVEYRAAAEGLKRERALFLAGAGPYRDVPSEEALRLLSEQVEARAIAEHERWLQTGRTRDELK